MVQTCLSPANFAQTPLACATPNPQHFTEIVGTPFYMAPEVLERRYGFAADVWSVGVVAFLMLAGKLPFDGATDRQIIKAVLDSEPDFGCPAWTGGGGGAGISAAARDCVRRMLVKDPAQRATIAELLQHPWLAGRPRSSCCAASAGGDAGSTTPCRFCSGSRSGSASSSSSSSNGSSPAAGSGSPPAPAAAASSVLTCDTGGSGASSRTSSVRWGQPCAVTVGDDACTPRRQQQQQQEQRSGDCGPPSPLTLSPLKHCRAKVAASAL
jgi:serine/threonine protein kinase